MSEKKSTIIHNFFEALTNIFIFLPYFFSVSILFKTLFSPWKNLTDKKKSRGFNMSAIMNQISFNLISRFMGLAMRSSLLIFYFIVQGLYMIFLPFIIILFFIAYPLILFFKSLGPDENTKLKKAYDDFMKTHLLDDQHRAQVEQWFVKGQLATNRKKQWWSLPNLFEMPPLARDWAMGYTPILDEYAEDLTRPSYQINIRGHIIGRDKESEMLERTLSQSNEANVILVGENGVGKHTIINSFARKVYEGKTTTLLAYKRVLRLNMEKILTEFNEQKKREEFLEELINEAAESKSVILLIDNFDRYVASDQERVDLSLAIEKYAKSPVIQFIGITTPFLYEKYIYTNASIRPLFTKVDIQEITPDIALEIALEKATDFEKRYRIAIPYETVMTIIDKSNYYITTIPFPEKALQLMDSLCVYTVQVLKQNVVMPTSVDAVLTQKTHVPTTLNDQIKDKLLHMEGLIRTKVIGQEEALTQISSTLRRSFLLLGKRKKPLSSFLFLGPTGVGKTETAKVISEVFFGSERELIRFDMSLYQSKTDIGKLVGSIELLNPGLLTNAIRENPYGVLLIDEIEKANHDLLNIFLTILDEGYFTDGYGQKVDCKNLVIVATSNAGAEHIYQMLIKQSIQNQGEGFNSNELINYLVENHIFSPEFLNRFDGIIAYKPIQADTAITIAQGIVNLIIADIFKMYQVKLIVSDETLKSLSSQGYNTQYGVRNLERVLRQGIEDRVAKEILSSKVKAGDTIQL